MIPLQVLFATNANLNQLVIEGEFRQDLLFRINTVEIEIPPLRKRPEDIISFVNYYLESFKAKYHKPELTISEGKTGQKFKGLNKDLE